MTQNNQIDTIYVVNYCTEGTACKNHLHGVIDTSYYFTYSFTDKPFIKMSPIVDDNGMVYHNVYKDPFGRLFYTEQEMEKDAPKPEPIIEKHYKSDSITVGTKVYPAATPFVITVPERKEIETPKFYPANEAYQIGCFPVLNFFLTLYLFNCFVNKTWSKLITDIINA